MRYRLLNPEEWGRLSGLIHTQFLPHPETAACAVAENEGGEIVSVLFLQLQLHMEPFLILDRRVNFLRMVEVLENTVKDQPGLMLYCIPHQDVAARMARVAGFTPLPYTLFAKQMPVPEEVTE